MARSTSTGAEFISSVFKPNVLVLTSTDADLLCVKNHLTFTDLLKPFSKIEKDVLLRDQNNISHYVKNLRINFVDINNVSLPNTEVKKLLNEVVSKCCFNYTGNTLPIKYGDIEIAVPVSTPWFEAWRKIFLDNIYQSDHEFLGNYLSCIMVVSSFNNDILDQFQRLLQQLKSYQQSNSSKFFNQNILKYFVLIHDQGQGDRSKADELFKQLKSTYDGNCFLLAINSASTKSPTDLDYQKKLESTPDPWIQYLIPGGNIINELSQNYISNNVESNAVENSISLDYYDDPLRLFKSTHDESASKYYNNHQNSVKNSTSFPQLSSSNNSFFFGNANSSSLNDSTECIKIKSDINKPHGQCLSTCDLDSIQEFVYEFVSFALVPWVESTLKQLNEQIANKMKMSRGLFNVTRKFFGGSSSVNTKNALNSSFSVSASNLNNTSSSTRVVYTSEAVVMQMRRHADLAFLFQQYELAYQTYNVLKKEFQDDSAWLDYAGTMEMSALSIFLQGTSSQRQYPFLFMDSAINIYLNQNKNIDYATRAALLNCEALKNQGMYLQASNQFIKLTTEENDLRSALLLEQSAHFYLYTKTPMLRKYVFHLILAGHRYGKAGQKLHTIRCYTQALPIFKGRNWTLAEDHIYSTISRHAYHQKQLNVSLDALRPLLSKHSRQSPILQANHLREYLKTFREFIESSSGSKKDLIQNHLPEFPLPLFDCNSINILLGQTIRNVEDSLIDARDVEFSDNDQHNATWQKLETHILEHINPNINVSYSKFQFSFPNCLTKFTKNFKPSICVVGESITVQLTLENPLFIPVVLTDLYLLWQFIPTNNCSVLTNEIETESLSQTQDYVACETLSNLCLLAKEKKSVELSIIPKMLGDLKIIGLSFNLNSNSINQHINSLSTDSGTESDNFDLPVIKLRGKINFLECQFNNPNDQRLNFTVSSSMPKLKVVFSNFPKSLIFDELCKINISLTNTGKDDMKEIYVAISPNNFITFGQEPDLATNLYKYCEDNSFQSITCHKEDIKSSKKLSLMNRCHPIKIGLDQHLKPGNSINLPLWIRFQNSSELKINDTNKMSLRFLFYYESVTPHKYLKYRLLRHKSDIDLKNTINLNGQFLKSKGLDNKSHLMNLKIENPNHRSDNKSIDFEINQITAISKSCKLDQAFCDKNAIKSICIQSKQTQSIYLKLDRVCSEQLTQDKYFSNIILSSSSNQKPIQSYCSPCLDFFNLNQENDLESIKTQGDIENQKEQNLIKEDVSFIVFWKATCRYSNDLYSYHFGQSHIFSRKIDFSQFFNQMNSLKKGSTNRLTLSRKSVSSLSDVNIQPIFKYSKLINISQQFEQNIQHDFRNTRKLIVPVIVSLFNTSSEELVIRIEPSDLLETHSTKFILADSSNNNLEQTHNSLYKSSSSNLLNISTHETPNYLSCSNILWIGQTAHQISMKPYQSLDIKLKGLVTRPGVYEVQSLIVKAAFTNNTVSTNELMSASNGSQNESELTFIKQDNLFSSLLTVGQINDTTSS